MTVGDAKRKRDEFFASLDAILEACTYESTNKNPSPVTLQPQLDPRDPGVPNAE